MHEKKAKTKHSLLRNEGSTFQQTFQGLEMLFFCGRPGSTTQRLDDAFIQTACRSLFAAARAEQRDVKSYFTAKDRKHFGKVK